MLKQIPDIGGKCWKDDVNADLMFVPVEVTFLGYQQGMIRYRTDGGMEYMWYSSQFFNTRDEVLAECVLLEQESRGIITPRKAALRAEYRKQLTGLVRIC